MKRIFYFLISGAIFFSLKSCFFGKTKVADNKILSDSGTTVYNIALKALDGTNNLDLNAYKGKKILFVNVASKCGYTPQYEGLQKLFEENKDRLVIIGCPCNQFASQEPGTSEEIGTFCKKNYGVTFPLSEKLKVHGGDQHPLYAWLTDKSKNGILSASVSWNFNKFLVNENGKLMAYFPSNVKPDDAELLAKIKE